MVDVRVGLAAGVPIGSIAFLKSSQRHQPAVSPEKLMENQAAGYPLATLGWVEIHAQTRPDARFGAHPSQT
jgi:hypothetical protein